MQGYLIRFQNHKVLASRKKRQTRSLISRSIR